MNTKTTSIQELQTWLNDRETVVIDVQPAECFEAGRLPGAKNACVYQVDFLDVVKKLAPNPSQRIVVYGSSAKNLASSVAARKLAAAGYKNVVDFKDGVAGWREAGHAVEGTKSIPKEATPEDKTYLVDTEKSVVEWIGRNIGGKHTGTIGLSSGEVTLLHGKVTGGHFVIDMKTIRNSDIEDQSMRAMLIQHLMSDDFFEVAKYPTATFGVSDATPISEALPGTPNYLVRGNMTIKDVTREIEFPALIGLSGGQPVAQAYFDIDRTQWNVVYGSGRLFEHLGMHLVNDLVSIQLKIVLK